ncbi:MAG: ribosome-associated translation inhibitor RaiA [Bacteroidales bacterium]|jgi:putative sigma-54 modulation protein|nr:ribosome-associated translation inhibitor RaiA [Bacteroidales bacterium]
MDIKINSVHFDADQKLIALINKKLTKLAQFFDGIISAEVFLRLEKVQSDENKIVEIKLSIPGNDLFVKKQSKTFEDAFNKGIESLSRQVTKHKEKLRNK